MPDREIVFDDAIQGVQRQNPAKEVGDFVLRRADGLFAYQLAVVADDIEQGINHVVRGADLLASTPRQIWLYDCLDQTPPHYAHLPLAVNAAGEKLSKQTRAAPVKADDPVAPLTAAMRFLNLDPGKGKRSLKELWNWAIMHWSVRNVPRKQTIENPEPIQQEKQHDRQR